MSSVKGEKTSHKLITLIVLVFVGAVLWFAAPFILPVYRWKDVDFEAIAQKHQIPVAQIKKQKVLFRWEGQKRGKDEPYPWQLINQSEADTPDWVVDEKGKKVNEYKTLVRVHLISDRTGEEPRWMMRGITEYDQYYKAEGWRLPPGSLGLDAKRFIFLVDASTIEKMDAGEAKGWKSHLESGSGGPEDWISDDYWDERWDGYGDPDKRK